MAKEEILKQYFDSLNYISRKFEDITEKEKNDWLNSFHYRIFELEKRVEFLENIIKNN